MILNVKNLNLHHKDVKEIKPILHDISFNVKKNSCLGILGESGSGKSMTCKSLMGLLDKKSFNIGGEVYFKDEDILRLDENEGRRLRGKAICMILQNPMTAFNPLYTIENQVIETFLEHLDITKIKAKELAVIALEKMNLKNPTEILNKYPHELSGGMLQRIMIGITIALEPELIIADEPTTAIDCLNQIEVIKEFKELRKKLKTSMIFITHDLGVLAQIADEVVVMDKGRIIEEGTINKIINEPKHEHTKYLINTRLKLIKKFQEVVS